MEPHRFHPFEYCSSIDAASLLYGGPSGYSPPSRRVEAAGRRSTQEPEGSMTRYRIAFAAAAFLLLSPLFTTTSGDAQEVQRIAAIDP